MTISRRLLHMGIALNQLCNVFITLGRAWPDETISSHVYRLHKQNKPWGKFWMPVIDFLFAWQGPEHCRRAYDEDRKRLQFPLEMR